MVSKGLGRRAIEALERMGVPRSTIDHLLQAEKETLLAARSVIDTGVSAIDLLLRRGEEKPVEKVDIQ